MNLNLEFDEYDFFVRKNLFSVFHYLSFSKRLIFSRVDLILDNISLWDTRVNFVLKCEFLQGFLSLNLNRLKNIFFKLINDVRVWNEIEKMINSNFVSFSKDYIYINKNNMGLNSLSFLLFNIYLSEFDFYLIFRV